MLVNQRFGIKTEINKKILLAFSTVNLINYTAMFFIDSYLLFLKNDYLKIEKAEAFKFFCFPLAQAPRMTMED
jgi:hypothetical protein